MGIEVYILALLVGVLAGLRTVAAPAAISWAARFGVLHLRGTPLGFLGAPLTPWILTLFAIVELVTDQLPSTPSRKTPMQFIARVLSGGLCGAAIGISSGNAAGGLLAGAIGAVFGTVEGYEVRRRLAASFHRDRPAALIEDSVTIVGLLLAVLALASLT
jgi:uncharacterized membrane protein